MLISRNKYIAHMTRFLSCALHNGYLTTLIMWYNICIYHNNKQNSNIVIFVKTFYETFICNLHHNAVSDTQGCRHIGVGQQSWLSIWSWLRWASATLILELSQNQISPASKTEKINAELISRCTWENILNLWWISKETCQFIWFCCRNRIIRK